MKGILNFFKEIRNLRKNSNNKNGSNGEPHIEINDVESVFTKSDVESLIFRNQFSKYLPYRAFDLENKLFYCQDETIGFVWECIPVLFMSTKEIKTLEGIFRLKLPEFSVIQVILFADPYIEPYLQAYINEKQYAPAFVKRAYVELSKHYLKLKDEGLIPSRRFRLFITLKIPVKEINKIPLKDLVTSIEDILKGAGLFPERMEVKDLIALLRRLFNDIDYDIDKYTPYTEINKQIIFADTEIERDVKNKVLKIGNKYFRKYFRCTTPKSLPQEIDIFWANAINGLYTGVSGDISQINTPFIYTLNVIFRELKNKIHGKANVILSQQSFGSFVPTLMRKKQEFLWVVDAMESEQFLEVMFSCWVFSENEQKTRESLYRTIRLWEQTGAVMQEESILLVPMFLYSLPLGFYTDANSLEILDRTFIVPASTIAAMMPIQVDYLGTGSPAIIFQGRKGQVVGFDIFAKGASNYNWYVAAPSGKGKSFTVNYLVCNYFGRGAKIRIVDIGGSYKKLAKIFKGKFIEFTSKSNICLNPFSSIRDPQYDLPVIASVVQQMAISQSEVEPEKTETAYNLIKSAVEYTYKHFGKEGSIDHVYGYLAEFPRYSEEYETLCEGKEVCAEDFKLIATHLAFNLYKFTTGGAYGRWFNGQGNLNIAEDDFVVLELEELKPQKDLYKVVILQVLNFVTMDLYLSDRSRPRMVILDEAWQFLQDSKVMQNVIEEGYRRARKYGGSFGIITQSLLDFEKFGGVGNVINSNCEFKFFLESGDFDMANHKKIINYDEFTLEILKTIKYNAPKYSELFVHSDTFGCGVVRLMVDRYSYYVYTSNPKEISQIESYVNQGLSYEAAIEKMLNENK